MLYLNSDGSPTYSTRTLYLTLTNVVFEYVNTFTKSYISINLTLTNVVFEF